MPRIARILPPGAILHIVCRGNNKQKVFYDDKDKQAYLDLVLKYKKDHPFLLYHYCLMPNHVHLLIEISEHTDLSAFMKKLNLAYFYYFKARYGYSGHFWQDRFKSFLIDRESYLLICGKYIELNPVRAGMAKRPEEYKFSSYRFYVLGEENELLDSDPLFLGLSSVEKERRESYKEFAVPKEVIQEKFKGPFWGSKEFVEKMKKRLKYRENVGKKVSFRKISLI
ncbi:transposase [Patescibacteria group bacterium]|nr:transposase [Patescibacteria group bacterium]